MKLSYLIATILCFIGIIFIFLIIFQMIVEYKPKQIKCSKAVIYNKYQKPDSDSTMLFYLKDGQKYKTKLSPHWVYFQIGDTIE